MYRSIFAGKALLLVVSIALFLFCACAAQEAAAPEAAADMVIGDEAAAEEMAAADVELSQHAGAERKIIGRAHIDLIVADPAVAIERIRGLASQFGGYVSNADLYRRTVDDESLLHGSMTLRIPAGRLDQALRDLEALAVSVESMDLNREDVSDQYTDIEAQLRNLEAAEMELRELLSEVRAKPNAEPEDILIIHREIVNLRNDIEQLTGRQNMLDNLIALSTIEVQLRPEISPGRVSNEGWQPGVVVRRAWNALMNALQEIGHILIWFVVYVLPLLVLLAIPILVIYWIVRRLRKR